MADTENTNSDSDFHLEFPKFEKKLVLEKQTIVKFRTFEDNIFTRNFPYDYPITKIKSELADLFKVNIKIIELLYNDIPVRDNNKLNDFPTTQFGTLELILLTGNKTRPIQVKRAYKDITNPDILTVRIQTENNGFRDVVVEIENKAIDKPNLGGYRHLHTGVQYLHGYSQTGPPKSKVPPENKNHRDTQTYFLRNRITEMAYEHASQMTNTEIWIPNISDKILSPRPYETAEEREKRLDIEGKVRIIQRYFRAWQITRRLRDLHVEYWKRIEYEAERDEKERLENEERKRKDLVRKVFPLTSSDFAMLYSMVDRWKKSEIHRISTYYCGAAKIVEFSMMLDKEIELLRTIENIRLKIRKDLEVKKIVDFFKAIGTPHEWYSSYKNFLIQMDSLETQKGREYFQLYKKVSDRSQTREERIESMDQVKQFLKNHNCEEKKHLNRLLDRAMELLARGVSENYLTYLQKNIELSLLQHFNLRNCNEGVTHHLLKMNLREMEKNMLYCARCQKLKTMEAFSLNARVEKNIICSSCKWLDKVQEPWVDLSPYRFILKQIRNYERLHKGNASVIYILQAEDIYHIINDIWHGHSAISECHDIYQLRLVRWRLEEEWSPWNCILLTLEETKIHFRIENLEDVYEKEFFNHVFNKHALAKQHFAQLLNIDKCFRNQTKDNSLLDEEFWKKKESADCLKLDDEVDAEEKELKDVEDDCACRKCEGCIFKMQK